MREKTEIPGGLALGSWQFGGDPYWPGQRHTDTLKALDAALRAGIAHFDTAQVYGNGRSEQLVGQRLKGRDDVFIATKLFPCPPEQVEKRVALSLRRLLRERIDLLYIHWPAGGKDLRPMMEALENERAAGRISLIGVSNVPAAGMERLSEAGRIDACQTGHSLIWRVAEEETIPWCLEHGVKVLAYAPLGQGAAAGRFPGGRVPEGDPRGRLLPLAPRFRPELGALLSVLDGEARSIGVSSGQLALAWSLTRPFLHGSVAGVRNRKQLEEAAAARDLVPGRETLDRLEEASLRLLRKMQASGIGPDENIFGHGAGS